MSLDLALELLLGRLELGQGGLVALEDAPALGDLALGGLDPLLGLLLFPGDPFDQLLLDGVLLDRQGPVQLAFDPLENGRDLPGAFDVF